MTFTAILADAYRRLNYPASPAADVVTRIKAYVNESLQELASEPGLSSLLRGGITMASVASQATYGLPPVVSRVMTLREMTTKRKLWPQSLDWYRTIAPDPSTMTGTPAFYVLLGPQSVARQPLIAAGSELFAKSTASGDTQVLQFEVVQAGGTVRTGTITLTGTTAVSLGSTLTDIVEVRDWYLASAAAGVVSLLETSGTGTVLGTIGIGQTRARYEGIALLPTPSSAITYTLDYEYDASDLVQDMDEPYWLPSRFHRLAATGARMKEYEKTDDDRFSGAQMQWDKGRVHLLAYVNNRPDDVLVPGRRVGGISDLGGAYPIGTIWD